MWVIGIGCFGVIGFMRLLLGFGFVVFFRWSCVNVVMDLVVLFWWNG